MSDVLDGPTFWGRRRGAHRVPVDWCFAFLGSGGSVAGYSGLIDGWLVMEEDVDVIKASAKLMAEYFQRMSAGVFHHWEDVFLDYVETFACEEDDVMVEL